MVGRRCSGNRDFPAGEPWELIGYNLFEAKDLLPVLGKHSVNQSVALGSESVGLSGAVDNQGNYDLTGTADISVAGFTLPNTAFTLTNAGLGVGAPVSLPDNTTVTLVARVSETIFGGSGVRNNFRGRMPGTAFVL